MATSVLRAAILVAAVVLGIFVLARAFPGGDDGGTAGGAPTTSTPKVTPSVTNTPKVKKTRKGKIKGVVVQVLNGTNVTGLAGSTTETLEEAGYAAELPGDAPEDSDETVIFYRADSKPHAELMQNRFFPQAVLRPATSAHSPGIQLTVVLGSDFAP